MLFANEIALRQPADAVFAAVSDVPEVAGCLPGARLEGRDGESYLGRMRMKVGPITIEYEGNLRFESFDTDARRATMRAVAKETNGQGGVDATITFAVSPGAMDRASISRPTSTFAGASPSSDAARWRRSHSG
ncbi:MAG: hypothetical protein JSU06_03015 [Actinobacteria bacterium]|nr:hypothetical protein [Actinomycetota bacterium]